MTPILKKAFDLFLFSSLFISICAVLMVLQTDELILTRTGRHYLFFVFFSTLTSYNFHWYLTNESVAEIERTAWSEKNKKIHIALILAGLTGSVYFGIHLIQHWFALGLAVLLTFLYSLPKIPLPFSKKIKKIAVGKTFFLSFVWTYVTTALPIIIANTGFDKKAILFILSRFFLIYTICILFDYRDKENDKKEGLKTMMGYLSDSGVKKIYYLSVAAFIICTVFLFFLNINFADAALLLTPAPLLLFIFNKVKNNFSDYLYYFLLDGAMALSSLFTLLIHI